MRVDLHLEDFETLKLMATALRLSDDVNEWRCVRRGGLHGRSFWAMAN